MATVPLTVTSKREERCLRCGHLTNDRIGVPTGEFPTQAMCKRCQQIPLKAAPHRRLRRYSFTESVR